MTGIEREMKGREREIKENEKREDGRESKWINFGGMGYDGRRRKDKSKRERKTKEGGHGERGG